MWGKIFVVVGLFVSGQAWAGIYLEPYVGYVESSLKGNETVTASGTTTTTDVGANEHGAAFGGKAGFSFLNFAAGADYMGGSLSGNGSSSTMQNIGAFAQVGIPLLAKFSATYFISAKDSASGASLTGNGFKAGVGLSFIPLISINIDYLSLSYNKSSQANTSISATLSGVMVGVSLPLDF